MPALYYGEAEVPRPSEYKDVAIYAPDVVEFGGIEWTQEQQQYEIERLLRQGAEAAAAQKAKDLEYYENYKAQEVAYYEATGEYGGYDPVQEFAETYVGIVDDTVEYVTEGGEYVVEEVLDLPEDIIEAGGEAGATIIGATAEPLAALSTPQSYAGVAQAAVAGLILQRKRRILTF